MFHIVYTLTSTTINQSAPNLVKIYMTTKSRMGSIMGLIGPEQAELFALEIKIAIFDFVYSLSDTVFNQPALHLAKIYMYVYITVRSWMSLIMDLIGLERLELFALELEKILHLSLFTL